MKFIFFFASTILIVLISEQSTMGLPLNSTVVEESCSTGFEMINGECMPILFTTNANEVESVSLPSKNIPIYQQVAVGKEIIPEKSGACPEGMEHGEHGICHEVELSETTEVNVESTTEREQNDRPEVNLMECPKGTKHDEQGACQEIKRANSTKATTDPKSLLEKDGSCPKDHKMVEGQCLYIKSKISSLSNSNYSIAGGNVSNDIQPKSRQDESSKYEVVPVLSDNSCPQGTEYNEYGLCQRRIRPSTVKALTTAVKECIAGFELINGKCTRKSTIPQGQFGLKTKTSMSESTTLAAEPISSEDSVESISESKFTTETPIAEKEDDQSKL